MAPPSFRLDTLAVNLIERLEPVRRAHLDDPGRARAALERTTSQIAANVAQECRQLLGDDAQARRIEQEAVDTFLPRYARLALDQNRAEQRTALTPVNVLAQRLAPVLGALIAGRVLAALAPGPWDVLFVALPFLGLFGPELLSVAARRRYRAELQALADDLGRLQDADERLTPTLAPPEPAASPTSPPTRRARESS